MDTPDFDAFLVEATEDEALRVENQRLFRDVRAFFHERIKASEVPHIRDLNSDIQRAQEDMALVQYMSEIVSLVKQEGESALRPFMSVYEKASWKVAEQIRLEKHIEDIAMLVMLDGPASNDELFGLDDTLFPTDSSEAKKRAIAHLIASEDLVPDNPWLHFLNQTLPGDSIDIASEEMKTLIHKAFVAGLEVEANITLEERTVVRDMELLIQSETNLSIIETHAVMDEIGHAASVHKNSSAREAAIFEITRYIHLNESAARALIDSIAKVFPLNSGEI